MITFDNVTKIYEKAQNPAIDHVSLNIENGEFVFIVGNSGSGKTTMIELMLKELSPTRERLPSTIRI
jgi:cell division transport system ATP-binding protein